MDTRMVLAALAVVAMGPAFAQSGNQRPVVTYRKGNALYAATPGTAPCQLWAEGAETAQAAWWPDGMRLAAVEAPHTGRTKLRVLRVDKETWPLSLVPEADLPMPGLSQLAVSPHGHDVALVLWGRHPTTGQSTADIFLLDGSASTSGVARPHLRNATNTTATPTTFDGSAWSPAWSPDGSQIAFCRWHGVWLLDVREGHQRRLAGGSIHARSPAFSPDGRHVVYVDACGGDQGLAGHWLGWSTTSPEQEALVVESLSTGERVQLTRGTQGADLPSWSPDGRWIALLRHEAAPELPGTPDRASDGVFADPAPERGPYDLWVVRPDGSDARRLATGLWGRASPQWAPAGHRIAFFSWEDDSDELLAAKWAVSVVDIDKSETVTLDAGRQVIARPTDLLFTVGCVAWRPGSC
jgi:Tol biopolymer transport system component